MSKKDALDRVHIACVDSLDAFRRIAAVCQDIVGDGDLDESRRRVIEWASVRGIEPSDSLLDPVTWLKEAVGKLQNVRDPWGPYLLDCQTELTQTRQGDFIHGHINAINAHEWVCFLWNEVLAKIFENTNTQSGDTLSSGIAQTNLERICRALQYLCDLDFPLVTTAVRGEYVRAGGFTITAELAERAADDDSEPDKPKESSKRSRQRRTGGRKPEWDNLSELMQEMEGQPDEDIAAKYRQRYSCRPKAHLDKVTPAKVREVRANRKRREQNHD